MSFGPRNNLFRLFLQLSDAAHDSQTQFCILKSRCMHFIWNYVVNGSIRGCFNIEDENLPIEFCSQPCYIRQGPHPTQHPLELSSSRFWGEQSFAVLDRTNMLNFMYTVFYCFCSSNRQAKQWAISTITLSALGKCEKSLNLENRSSILGVGLMRGFSSQNWAKVQIFYKVSQAGLTNQRDISKSITVTPLVLREKSKVNIMTR